jgi:hypothetical protein
MGGWRHSPVATVPVSSDAWMLVATREWCHSFVATVHVSSDEQMTSSEARRYYGSYLSSHAPPLNPNPRVFFLSRYAAKILPWARPALPPLSVDSDRASACRATVIHGDHLLITSVHGDPPPRRPLGVSVPSAACLPLPTLTMLACSRTTPSVARCAQPRGRAAGDLVHRAAPCWSRQWHR